MPDRTWHFDLQEPAEVHLHRLPDGRVQLLAAGAGTVVEIRIAAAATWTLEPGPDELEEPGPEQQGDGLRLPGDPATPFDEDIADILDSGGDEEDEEDDTPELSDEEIADLQRGDDSEPEPGPELPDPPGGDLPHETPAGPGPQVLVTRRPAPVPLRPRPPVRQLLPPAAGNPPSNFTSCGTADGIRQHRMRGERLCTACATVQAVR